MSINKRVKDIIDIKVNGRNVDFAKALNRKPNQVSNWLSEGASVGIDVVTSIIEAFPDVNANWLLTGELPMLKDVASTGVSIGHGNSTGDIVSGGSVNKNTTNLVLPNDGPQKIIKPDAQIEIYLNQMEVLEQKIAHLESIISAKDELINSKNETIRMKDEIIEMLKGR